MPEKLTETEIQDIADVIWWLRGYAAAQPPDKEFRLNEHYIEVLGKVRRIAWQVLDDGVKSPSQEEPCNSTP